MVFNMDQITQIDNIVSSERRKSYKACKLSIQTVLKARMQAIKFILLIILKRQEFTKGILDEYPRSCKSQIHKRRSYEK